MRLQAAGCTTSPCGARGWVAQRCAPEQAASALLRQVVRESPSYPPNTGHPGGVACSSLCQDRAHVHSAGPRPSLTAVGVLLLLQGPGADRRELGAHSRIPFL